MCDEPVQTYVRTEGEWRHFQEYLILQHSEPPLEGVEFRGAEQARVTPGGAGARSRGRGDRDRPLQPDREHRPDAGRARACARRSRTPTRRSSRSARWSAGRSLKGPTEAFMRWAGLAVDDGGVAACYAGIAAGHGRRPRHAHRAARRRAGIVLHQTDTLMADAEARARLAREALDFAAVARRIGFPPPCPPQRSCPSSASTRPSSASATALGGPQRARRSRPRCSRTCWRELARGGAGTARRGVAASRAWQARRGAVTVIDDREQGQSPAALAGPGARRGARLRAGAARARRLPADRPGGARRARGARGRRSTS